MCAIFGALLHNVDSSLQLSRVNHILEHIIDASQARGRDGIGFSVSSTGDGDYNFRRAGVHNSGPFVNVVRARAMKVSVIGNCRAEPTTEFVKVKLRHDQQPYLAGSWGMVHNGTIANDTELRTGQHESGIDSAAIVETLVAVEKEGGSPANATFSTAIRKLKGSYAILARRYGIHDRLFFAVNYRPLWYIETDYGVFFASSREFFPDGYAPQMIKPYTQGYFSVKGGDITKYETSLLESPAQRSLVVCSGGMDSVVAAKAVIDLGHEVELIHFQYGSRAQGPEVRAVIAAAGALGVPVRFMDLPIYDPKDSPLLQADSDIAGGEAGAEFAHEWVPARNLLLLSVATAYAEANGFTNLVLGNNMEEAGAYPDNEPEFISRFNDILPFAVGAGKQLRVLMPVGNLMKHEIVALGLANGAPLHLTWSCYRAGDKHCGTCGPCYMRRKAFDINGANEVIEYER